MIAKPAVATWALPPGSSCGWCREAGLDEPWCQTFLTDDNALSERLATDPRVGFLSFIGLRAVG